MSKLVHGVKKGFKSVWNSFEDGSKQIGEALGFESAGVTPKSDKTKAAIRANTPPTIPMADEEALRRDRRRRLAGQAERGRASTILSQEDDYLGG